MVNVMKLGDSACLLELPSELTDPDEIPYLNACTLQCFAKNKWVILDFSAVQTMNGLGATMLVKLSVLARRLRQRILATGVSDHYKNVFKVTGLDRAFVICRSREEAFGISGVSVKGLPTQKVTTAPALDNSFWAMPLVRLNVPPMPLEAINRNMDGRRVVGPIEGFGQLWQKKYQLVISKLGITPEDAIKILTGKFPHFQPSYNRFYPTGKGIQRGEVVAIDSSTPGGPVSTGVMILYADDRSFTFITPQGHPESGWVTFSAFEFVQKTIVQILGLARANDPVYEAAFHIVGSKMQVRIWNHVLTSLATYLGIPADITVEPVCIDSRIQWSQASNVWYNAQIRTIFYMPFLLLKRASRNRPKSNEK